MPSEFDNRPACKFIYVIILLGTHFPESSEAIARRPAFKRVCYFAAWAQKRPLAAARVTIDQVDAELCTHVIYAFGKVDATSLDITGAEWDDESTEALVGNFEKFNELKLKNARLKCLISIGGEKAGSWPFDVVTNNETNARVFAHNAARFLHKWKFDGIDVDWEFPTDYQKFNLLLRALRRSLDKAELITGHHYLLSVAVGASLEHILNGYDIPTIAGLVDFINLMTYDYHGSWDRFTGGNAPLLPRTRDKRFNPNNNIEWTVKKWIESGAPRRKLILGVSAQARTYTLAKQRNRRVGAPSLGPGLPGKYTQNAGTLAYFEVCEIMFDENAETRWDKVQKFPFAFYGNQWLSFDNKRSIAIKAQMIIKRLLGGGMVWSLDSDDVTGRFCGEGRFPLTNTLKNTLTGKEAVQQDEKNGCRERESHQYFSNVTPLTIYVCVVVCTVTNSLL